MEKLHSLHLGIVAIEKRDFGSPSSKVTNFTFLGVMMWVKMYMIIFIQFSISIDVVHTQLNVKIVLFQRIQLSTSTQFKC